MTQGHPVDAREGVLMAGLTGSRAQSAVILIHIDASKGRRAGAGGGLKCRQPAKNRMLSQRIYERRVTAGRCGRGDSPAGHGSQPRPGLGNVSQGADCTY